jgi:integrase
MASIRNYRTSKGERRYEVRYRDLHGVQRSRSFSVRKDAQAFKLDVERRRQAGSLYVAPSSPFAAIAQEWLERFEHGAAGRVRPRAKTVALARESLRSLDPLSSLTVEQVRRPVVEDLVAQLAVRAPRRAEMSLALLKRILRSAEERGHSVDGAVYRIRIAPPEEREPVLLTWDEVDELRSWLPEYIARIVPLAVLTLCRQGELLALRDRDVYLDDGALVISGQLAPEGRVPTKTRAGRRTVDIGPLAVRLFRAQQLARVPNDPGLLFPTRTGRPFDRHRFMGRVFKPAARASGLPRLTFHDLRHTGASLMIAAGCHVKVIAEQMGHSDGGALVLKRYGHLYKGARKHAALALESHISSARAEHTVGSVWDEAQQTWDFR